MVPGYIRDCIIQHRQDILTPEEVYSEVWVEFLEAHAQVFPVDFGNLMFLTSQSSDFMEKVAFRGSRPPEPVSNITIDQLFSER